MYNLKISCNFADGNNVDLDMKTQTLTSFLLSNRNYILYFLVFLVSLSALPVQSRTTTDKRIIWSKKRDRQTGLYTTRNPNVTNGFSLTANAMYYFGDADNEGVAFNGGFNKENLSYGGSLIFAYLMPVGNHSNLRFSFMGGTLSGNNKAKFDNLTLPRDDYRKFTSFIIQPAVGVECYPFSRAGFYLYGGIALTASIINNFEFYYYKSTPGGKVRTLLQGETFGFLPMIQLGLGYNWSLSQSWSLGVELMIQEGLIDTHYMNLDGYPLAPSQNSDGVALGGSFGTYVDRYGKEQLRWNDGWYHLGITVTYHWANCEKCQILNNYQNIKGRRW